MMPIGSRHVVCARVMASRNSAADSSSQCTDSLLCTAGDCAEPVAAQRMLMPSNKDLYTCSPLMTFEHIVSLVGPGGRMRGALLAVMLLCAPPHSAFRVIRSAGASNPPP